MTDLASNKMKDHKDIQIFEYVHTGAEKTSVFRTVINLIISITAITFFIILLIGIGYAEHTNSGEYLFQQGVSHIQKAEQSESPTIRKKYFQQGFDSFMDAAKKDNAPAQYMIGFWLSQGRDGIDQDIPKGINWLEKSAKQGHDNSMVYLAELYLTNEEYQDIEKAYTWSLKAANLNNGRAMYYLHLITADDSLKYYNENESSSWLIKAVDAEDPDAMFTLAVTKFQVVGTSSENSNENIAETMLEGIKLLRKASEQGNIKATELLRKIGQD